MNLAKIIAKFLKDGFAKLEENEKKALLDNKELLSPAQQKQLEDGDGEPADDEGEESEEEEGDEPKEPKEGDEGVDEKALKSLIQKGVKDTLESKMESISNNLVQKFLSGVAAQRGKAIVAGAKTETKGEETRKFVKALMRNDFAYLKQFKAKADYNQTGDNEDGAYTVPEELRAEVLRIAETQYGVARREMFYLPFSGPGNERKIPTLSSSVVVTWVNEANAKSKTKPEFGLVTQTLKKLAAIVPFTEEIIEDSAINLTTLLATLFAEAVAKEEDLQFFAGTGSPWTGIINNTYVNKVYLGSNKGFDDITADVLLDMIDETPAGALAGAKFYLHRHALSVIRKLKDVTSGQYIFQNPGGGLPGTIWNYPYELVEALPDKTTSGDGKSVIMFGNLKVGAIFGDKQQIRTKLLTEASIVIGETTINLAEQDMMALRVVERVGYVAAVPTALTVLKTGAAS